MVIYAHRGNLEGPSGNENQPEQVDAAIAVGFSVEVDVRVAFNRFYLGHDKGEFPVDSGWIDLRYAHLLLHLKSDRTVREMRPHWHFFCHQSDPFVLTSRGQVWCHAPTIMDFPNAIIPLMTMNDVESFPCVSALAGVCTDWPLACRERFH